MRQIYKECLILNLSPLPRLLGLLTFFSIFSNFVVAQNYNVTNTTDGSGTNQLRGAIAAADGIPGSHTITVAAGTYNLTLGEIIFGSNTQNITITGAGAANTIINMTTTGQDRIFLINPPGTNPDIQTTISGITFTGGKLTSDTYGGGAIICGGPNNTVTINNCVFNNNSTTTGNGSGGAIQMNGGGVLSLNLCTFTNNVCPDGAGGALYYFLPNNINGVDLSGNLTVTNCTFSNNSVTGGSSSGGAIAIGVQGALVGSTTSVISIQNNNFTGNHADATTSFGGAISITNSFSASNSALINFNRFAGNTSSGSSASALAMTITRGSVDATNNWWGCNTGATTCSDKAAILVGTPSSGTLTTNPWLQLSATPGTASICSGAPTNTSVVTASFLKNSAGTAITAANLSALTGVPVSFNAVLGNLSGAQATIQSTGTATVTYTASGAGSGSVNAVVDNVSTTDAIAKAAITVNASPAITAGPVLATTSCPGDNVSINVTATGSGLTYQWYKGTTALSNGVTGTGSTVSGVTTSTLNILNASSADNAANYNVVITGTTCQTTSSNLSLAVPALSLANATATNTVTVSSTNTNVNNSSCMRIVKVLPSGSSPVTGSITGKVTLDGSQPTYNGQPYLVRHYDISPVTSPNTATATLTLYFLQSEFDTYNAVMPGTLNDLPTGPSDAVGKANLRVTQFHGTGTVPGGYSGWSGSGPASVLINPGAGNVVWNSTQSWWEVTFNVTGFSGFYVTGLINFALPIGLETFSGVLQGSTVLLNWTISEEKNVAHYEVQMSPDATNFTTIKSLTAINNRSYNFSGDAPGTGIYYYRLKIVDTDSRITYSNIIAIQVSKKPNALHISPNPFLDKLLVQIEVTRQSATTLILTDISGNVLLKQISLLRQGSNTVIINKLNGLSKGTYMLRVINDEMDKTLKVVKD